MAVEHVPHGGGLPSGSQPDSAYSYVRLAAALSLMTIGMSGMYAVVVALKLVAVEFGVSRGIASLTYTVTMVGFGLGGVAMGRLTDRFGVMRPAIAGTLALALGLVVASRADSIWLFCLAQGALIGMVGQSVVFAPMVADISHWFVRRRGLAVGIVISGSYLAGTVWPPIIQHFYDSIGWRETYFGLGVFCLCTMLPLSLVMYRRAPVDHAGDVARRSNTAGRPLAMAPGLLQWLLCAAGVGCCVAMAMPQVHIVAYATDLGHAARRGAEMLSLMLGCGVVSRIAYGWVSDRIGGLRTLVLGSALQALALVLFLPADGLASLYLVSALFGLSQGGIIPSYAIIVRTFFPAGDAGWRIGATLLFTMLGMALGGWMSGMLYDLTGSYDAAFINAIGFNIVNLSIAGALLRRSTYLSSTR